MTIVRRKYRLIGLLTVLAVTTVPPASASPELSPHLTAVEQEIIDMLLADVNPELDNDGSISPPGANDWSCTPGVDGHRPRPVVLVHGTWANQSAWDKLSPELHDDGYCVFTLNYGRDDSSVKGKEPGVYATGDIPTSAVELSRFIDKVRGVTGSSKVDVVAHSQGGPMVRQYLRFNGGADKVDSLVTVAGTNHGTTSNGLALLAHSSSAQKIIENAVGKAAVQQLYYSDFIRQLNADGDTESGVHFTAMATHADKVSTPPEATFLTAGPGATVTNLWLEDISDEEFSHAALPDTRAVEIAVKNSLGED